MGRFEEQLAVGRLAESAIVNFLRSRGNAIITVYEIEHKNGLGPRFLTKTKAYVAPDVLVFSGGGKVNWCETKHKSAFSWYRKGKRWVTGIDLRHYADYQRVEEESGLPVWLLFLHVTNTPSAIDRAHGSPEYCPVGLYGGSLKTLKHCESHRSDRWGRSGMVYWAREDLRLLAPITEFQREAA